MNIRFWNCKNRTKPSNIPDNDRIFADSAEPKSIAELRGELGIKRILGVKKGPDSVEYGERWLDDLDAIYIDPKRTPKIAWEFENID